MINISTSDVYATYKVDANGTEQITYSLNTIPVAPEIDVLYDTESEVVTKTANFSITGEGKITTKPHSAAIKEIRGKSIVWNQLVQNGDISDIESNISTYFKENVEGLTLSYSNGMLKGVQSMGTMSIISDSVKTIAGHKYMLSAYIQAESTFSFYHRIGGVNADSITGTSGYKKSIITAKTANPCSVNIVSAEVYIKNWEVIDLTLMFGAGNEPATVEEFEKMFPLDYYDYNAGEVIPFAGQNLTTTGKNQYNPASGKANLLGGQTYQLLGTYTGATIDGVAVTLDSNDCFTTTKDCVLDVTGGNDTDTFVGLYNGETNTYEPYEKHTLPLDPSQWRDKDGNLVFPYGGMHGVGTAYDYVKVDADGYIRKAVRCFGQVDLGTLDNWSNSDVQRCNNISLKGIIKNVLAATKPLLVSTKYIPDTTANTYNHVNDKTISIKSDGTISIWDSALASVTFEQIKSAMSGVYLNYELAEPVEIELATPIYALGSRYITDENGTEKEVYAVYQGSSLIWNKPLQ